jgi:hypothetical protein
MRLLPPTHDRLPFIVSDFIQGYDPNLSLSRSGVKATGKPQKAHSVHTDVLFGVLTS